jgi:DNA-binding transcriptional LysR family regulator
MDRLKKLQYFVASVRLGGFSKAGRAFGVTPASISRQIALLEDQLGLRLLNRTTRQLSLTEIGALFYDRADRIVQEMADAEELVRSFKGAPRGVLRITAPASFGRLHIAPWIGGFLEDFPDIALDLHFTDRLVDIYEEKIDVAIRITAPADSSVICRLLARQRSVACASPAYFARRPRPSAFADLSAHNCLTYGRHTESVWRFYRDEREVGRVEARGNVHSRDGDSIYAATLAGVGVSIQPIWRAAEDLRSGRLIDLFPGFAASSIGGASAIHAYYSNRRHLAPKIKVFVDYLATTYGAPPYWERAMTAAPAGAPAIRRKRFSGARDGASLLPEISGE